MKVRYKMRFDEAKREIARLKAQMEEGLILCWDYYGGTFTVVYRGM